MFGISLAKPIWDITEASWVDQAANPAVRPLERRISVDG